VKRDSVKKELKVTTTEVRGLKGIDRRSGEKHVVGSSYPKQIVIAKAIIIG
jgi:hypothetical protein